MSEIKKVG